MIDRTTMLVAVAVTVALVAAQDFTPSWTFVHTESYAVVLTVLLWILGAYAVRAGSGKDGPAGRGLALTALGGFVVGVTGLVSGLMGPDTQTILRAPGSVAVLDAGNAAAAFPVADAQTIARGDAHIVLRRRSGGDIDVPPGKRRFTGTAVVESTPKVAAYVDVFDERGRHLTITQPTGPAFLSPVLQFVQTIEISGRTLPSDTFAAPAVGRTVTAVYISPSSAAAMHAERLAGHDVVLFSVRDGAGKDLPGGIGVAASGAEASVGGLLIRVTIGTYPELLVGSAPHPIALVAGGALMLAGLIFAPLSGRPRRAAGAGVAVEGGA